MKYLFSDFYLLLGVADKGCRSVGDAYRRMAELMGIPVGVPCLAHALTGLCAGGYATVTPSDGVITADTPISLTAAGKSAATVSGLQKLMGEAKALNKKELGFCGLDRPADAPSLTVDGASFASLAEGLLQSRTVAYPLFDLKNEGEGQLTLTVRHPACDYTPSAEEASAADLVSAEDPDAAAWVDSISVTGAEESILQAVSQLLELARDLMTSPRTRKVALHGAKGSYIVTLAHTASEYGTALRMTVAQIRFNRQRFYGKRDSDLDYAQCGSPLITLEMNGAKEFAARLLPSAAALPATLGEEEREIISAIHKKLKS